MPISRYIRIPFAESGDRDMIPDSSQTDGMLSWPDGWGPDYQKDLANNADAKPIDRLTMNQLFNVITTAVKASQEKWAPQWISREENNGNDYVYRTGDRVTLPDDGKVYVSLADNNTRKPGEGVSTWGTDMYRSASTGEVSIRNGKYPTLPQDVAQIVSDMRQPIPVGTVDQRGIVQLSDAVYGDRSARAATEYAVGQKLSYGRNVLENQNLNSLRTAGVYWQNVAKGSDLNYPEQVAGILYVAGSEPVIQQYVTATANVYVRGYTNNNWSAWTNIVKVAAASADRSGTVRVSDDSFSQSNAEKRSTVSSQLATTSKLSGYRPISQAPNGASTDLNSMLASWPNRSDAMRLLYGPLEGEWFCPALSEESANALHYPTIQSGILTVVNANADTGVRRTLQRYAASTGQTYTRTYSNNGWSAWVSATQPSNLPRATQQQQGAVRFATQEQADAGERDDLAISPATLHKAQAGGGGNLIAYWRGSANGDAITTLRSFNAKVSLVTTRGMQYAITFTDTNAPDTSYLPMGTYSKTSNLEHTNNDGTVKFYNFTASGCTFSCFAGTQSAYPIYYLAIMIYY